MLTMILTLAILTGLPIWAQLRDGRLHVLYFSGAFALVLSNLMMMLQKVQMGRSSITLSQADGTGGFHETRYVLSQGYASNSFDIALLFLGLVVLALHKWGALYFRRATLTVFWGFYGAAVLAQFGVLSLMNPATRPKRYVDYADQLTRYEQLNSLSLIVVYVCISVFTGLLIWSLMRRFIFKN